MIDRKILIAGGICASLTVVTTLIVHLVEIPAATFEERLQLIHNSTYIGRNIATIIHCICVAISMAAMAAAKKENILMKWGAVSFLIFSLAEIIRMLTALVFINGLRSQYLSSDSAAQQEMMRFILDIQWPLIGGVLFTLFIIAFGFGCLFMGMGVIDWSNRFDTIIGYLFIFWAVQSLSTIGNDNLGWGLDPIISFLSITFQPLMRVLVAVWLFRAARSLHLRTSTIQ